MESDRFERVMTVINREVPDRVPWSVWGHFPAVDWLDYYSWEKANRDGEEAAKAHMALLRELDYKMDLLKGTFFSINSENANKATHNVPYILRAPGAVRCLLYPG